ncbi:MAG: glycosyltransferase [Burkholderiaceae bacterium]|nr:glycosyltransferase [Burkholderiaceae bacterium]
MTVSVVSHAQGQQVLLLLQDLDRHCRTRIAQVIVTCNVPERLSFASGEALCDFGFPVEVIANAKPKGFGANHNQAFARCASDWFLIVNPDVRIDGDVLGTLLMRATQHDAILAPQEVRADGARLDGVRGPITPLELLRRRVFRRSVAPLRRGGWVKGMFMLTRAEAFRQVQGFDERYFLYGEDADLCARLMLAGWHVTHIPQVAVTHDWQRASRRSWRHLRWHMTSLMRMWLSSAFWRYWALARRLNRLPSDPDGT